jgi:hypothetical protein
VVLEMNEGASAKAESCGVKPGTNFRLLTEWTRSNPDAEFAGVKSQCSDGARKSANSKLENGRSINPEK